MYIVISGKMGVLAPKPIYKQVKSEDRGGNRIVAVSENEAKALRTTASLKEANRGVYNEENPTL
jgi:hypothetical protein